MIGSLFSINPEQIIAGYAQGFFLMANESHTEVGWYSSRQRALIPLDDRFHCPRSLRPVLNQQRFQVAINRDFAGVVAGCADRPQTWISPQLMQIYLLLHRAGWAHSFETWQGDQLAGGILGITIGGAFIGESMFHRSSNASKVALVQLVHHLRSRHFRLFDAQLINPHLSRFGAYVISGKAYQQELSQAITLPCQFC